MAERLTEDQIQAQTTRAAAVAMGEWLIAAGITGKRVDQLHMADMEAMATAAISGWLKAREALVESQRWVPGDDPFALA